MAKFLAVLNGAADNADKKDFTDAKTAYAIVEADTHEDAAQLFSDHPHIALMPGNSIEVLECPPIPS
ncbi:hypothetical protein ACIBQ6_11555 [Nonomuraea sp. NPDC049655]|uniref:hypothetical protein n=1 Tax=Nonomuraea sp. NPDC049655 TaxID=3364355 RepID=UPI0037BE1147